MTASPSCASVNNTAQADSISIRRQVAIFLIIEFLLIFAPLTILGATINWPASLDEPARVNLPLILDQVVAMMTGYAIYFVYSLLFWPMAYLTGRANVISDTGNTLFRVATGFAAFEFVGNDWDRFGRNDYCLENPAVFLDVGYSNCVHSRKDIIN